MCVTWLGTVLKFFPDAGNICLLTSTQPRKRKKEEAKAFELVLVNVRGNN